MIKTLLSEKLQEVFKHVRGYGRLSEGNVAEAVREVRLALLAADVNYQVARDFCEKVKAGAMGEEVQGSIRPGDLFVKIVHDELIALFGQGDGGLKEERPLRILLCGLNGAGKTTTAGKLALRLKKQGERVLLVAADLTRPAAVDQLKTLGDRIGVGVVVPQPGATLLAHVRAARERAEREAARVVIFDTAGRLEADEALLKELSEATRLIEPQEALLVADAALGQQAVEVAKAFQTAVPLTGLVLTKLDGDARGGAALSLQSVTGCPIKFEGTGEKAEALEVFQPERFVGRMLGMGDLVGLVEKAQEAIDLEDAERLAEKMRRKDFNLEDFQSMMGQVKKMGPLQNLLGMIPGMPTLPDSALGEKSLKRTEAIICSMTPKERRRPEILNAKRRIRIASGSGTSVTEVNDLLKRFRTMQKMMSKFGRGGNPEASLKRMLSGRM